MSFTQDAWRDLAAAMKQRHESTAKLLTSCRPVRLDMEPWVLVVACIDEATRRQFTDNPKRHELMLQAARWAYCCHDLALAYVLPGEERKP